MRSHARSSDQALVDGIRAAYGTSVEAWAAGPATVYRALARALVAAADRPLADRRVLDLGAGTGVASDVLAEEGAHVIALDLAAEMLAHRRGRRPPGVAGDAQRLPFRGGAFDAVVAAFSLNHVPDLGAALLECRRVTGPGGLVVASTFPDDAGHPAKAAVEEVLGRFGYRRPAWYRTFQDRVAGNTGDATALGEAAEAAGLTDVVVRRTVVDAGVDDPGVAVAWRLDMPHAVGFVAGLEPSDRAALRDAATAAVADTHPPPTLTMLVLRARLPSRIADVRRR